MTYLFLWKIERRNLSRALFHMAIDRISLTRDPRVAFSKSLGTGTGTTFTPTDADISTWGLLVTLNGSEDSTYSISAMRAISAWRSFAVSEEFFHLDPIASHGLWAKRDPFLPSDSMRSEKWIGEVATITRARIKWHENLRFWRAVPEVTRSLHDSDGLIKAIGIGEAPIGLQGTFSYWRSQEDLRAFAYKGAAHQRAIEMTAQRNWYAEELFARFAVRKHELSILRPN